MTTTGTADGWVPSACTLPTVQQPLRLAEFDDLFRTSVHHATRTRHTHLDLIIDPEGEVSARELADRESGCCSFFRFSFMHAADGSLVMGISVPRQHVDVLDALHARIAATAGIGNDDA